MTELFDRHLRTLRRDRAARLGPELFLSDRAFEECLDRLRDLAQPFERALLIGCPSADWPVQLRAVVGEVEILDPGSLFADRCGGAQVEEDRHDFGDERFDLCIAVGTLDTVNDLPLALQLLRRALRPNSPLIGAIVGGNSLPALRSSMIEGGRAVGRVVARSHPRIEASSLAGLLSAAGFAMPVVDVDRLRIRYQSLDALARDLRRMGMTSILTSRAPALRKAELDAARKSFAAQGIEGRTEEIVEILHFVGWRQ